MFSLDALLLFAALILIYVIVTFVINGFSRPYKFPPGPKWYPIVGNTPELQRVAKKFGGLHKAFTHWSKKFNSEVIGLKLGQEYFAVVSSEPLLKQVFTDEAFQARPDSFFIRLRTMGERKGITMTDGPFWEEQRGFALRHLRDLGFGKSTMEALVMDELHETFETLKQSKEISFASILAPSVLNVLWALATGSRFSHQDPQLHCLLELMGKRGKAFDIAGGVLNQLPWLRHIAPDFTGYSLINQLNCELHRMITATIEEHKRTLTPNKTRDYIDAFLHEMNSKTENSTFTVDQLIMSCLDFFIAGSQTTSSTLSFAFLNVLVYPEIQERIHKEIDEVLQNGKLPTIADRGRLPYTEAFLTETQRLQSVVGISGPRRVLKDTQIGGYNLPKGTTVLINMYKLHHDSKFWPQPEKLIPERFLNIDSKQSQELFLFGLGKRRCLGEALARNFIFIFFVGIMKNFKLLKIPGEEPDLEPNVGILVTPKPYRLRVQVRQPT